MHRALATGLLVIASVTACSDQPIAPPPAPALATPVPDTIWESAFTRTDGWTGADGVATVPLSKSRTLWLFGDSFIGPVRDGKHAEGTTMVNNTIAISPISVIPPAPDALTFHWSQTPDHKPAAWSIPEGTPTGEKAEWFWPAGGGIVAPGGDVEGKERLLLFMIKLGRRADVPKDSIWNFEARGTTLLTIPNPQDAPDQWLKLQYPIAPLLDDANRQVTWGAAVLSARNPGDPADDLYITGIDTTSVLNKQLLLARARSATIERFDTWKFWDGKAWSPRARDAAPLASPLASEMSLHLLNLGDTNSPKWRYVMLYSELTLGPRILCRTADKPEGPWSEPQTLYTCPEPASDKKLMVYACKAHPELSRPGELLVSYCVNSTDFWDVIAHAEKYRPRFVRIPLAMLEPVSQ